MDYIKVKHDVDELQKQAAEWQRRIEVARAGTKLRSK